MPKTQRRDENDDDSKKDDDDDDAIQSVLVSGYKRFRRETMMTMCRRRRNKEEEEEEENENETMETRLKRLSREGQKGACKILCVSCCDSRCDPTAVFDAKPGEIFSVRNVANVVPPLVVKRKEEKMMKDHGTVSAIEYAVKSLEVEAIVVLGHAQCGGCAHALNLFSSPKTKTSETTKDDDDDDEDGSGSVDAWCGHIEESVKRVCSKTYDTEEERLRALEHENVRRSVENVQTYPFVRERVAKGALRVRGGFFTIRSGEVAMMDEDTKAFTPIKVDDDTK